MFLLASAQRCSRIITEVETGRGSFKSEWAQVLVMVSQSWKKSRSEFREVKERERFHLCEMMEDRA